MKLAIRLGLRAAHEEAFLDNLTVPDRVKPDLIEVHAFLALWRDLSLKANDELIASLRQLLCIHDVKSFSEPSHGTYGLHCYVFKRALPRRDTAPHGMTAAHVSTNNGSLPTRDTTAI